MAQRLSQTINGSSVGCWDGRRMSLFTFAVFFRISTSISCATPSNHLQMLLPTCKGHFRSVSFGICSYFDAESAFSKFNSPFSTKTICIGVVIVDRSSAARPRKLIDASPSLILQNRGIHAMSTTFHLHFRWVFLALPFLFLCVPQSNSLFGVSLLLYFKEYELRWRKKTDSLQFAFSTGFRPPLSFDYTSLLTTSCYGLIRSVSLCYCSELKEKAIVFYCVGDLQWNGLFCSVGASPITGRGLQPDLCNCTKSGSDLQIWWAPTFFVSVRFTRDSYFR